MGAFKIFNKISPWNVKQFIILFLGVVLLTAGIFSFLLGNSNESGSAEKLDTEMEPESIYDRFRNFGKKIKSKVTLFFDFLSNGFSYINDLIVKVILPRLSTEQRSKFYSAIRFFKRIKNLISTYYYYFICAIAVLIIYHQSKKMFKATNK